jgi:hypothetical protein
MRSLRPLAKLANFIRLLSSNKKGELIAMAHVIRQGARLNDGLQ